MKKKKKETFIRILFSPLFLGVRSAADTVPRVLSYHVQYRKIRLTKDRTVVLIKIFRISI